MPQVNWESTYAVWAAVARRRAIRRSSKKLGGINIATFLWSDGTATRATTRWSESPLGTGADHTLHSEEVIWNEIQGTCRTIFWVFTERAPCPPHPVGRGCRVWLADVLTRYGASQGNTPIYWIYAYPDNQGVDFEQVFDLRDRFSETQKKSIEQGYPVKPIWNESAAKLIRSESTDELKGLDAGIEEAYSKFGKTKRNLVKRDIHKLKTDFASSNAGVIVDMP